MRVFPPSLSQLHWLPSLKASQLQRVAFLTGISSSGTKSVLIERLTAALSSPVSLPLDAKKRLGNGKFDANSRDTENIDGHLSILSIDMGIRNLAYAHLLVYPESNRTTLSSRFSSLHSPILNVWNRLVISEFPNSLASDADTPVQLPILGVNPSNGKAKPQRDLVVSDPTNANAKTTVAKESFAPELYASHAYTLITSLIAAYQPTHILIERQRFRSGGGAAVQEWTIRVGVFEGMLYAVLHTLQRESKTGGLKIAVQGVEPQRVAKYWMETDSATKMAMPETKKKVTSKEGKKNKIDLAGRWISSAVADGKQNGLVNKVSIGTDSQAQVMAAAYMHKWSKGRNGSGAVSSLVSTTKRSSTRSTKHKKKGDGVDDSANATIDGPGQFPVDIGKLDDLADCLLQGVAWLEWQRMKERIGVEGIAALGSV